MMRIQVDAPWCTRFRIIAWACRAFGIARKWEASGRNVVELLVDLTRLGASRQFVVLPGMVVQFSDDKPHVVTSR
jgi:hypothetical protein